jgi:hypothetical protein
MLYRHEVLATRFREIRAALPPGPNETTAAINSIEREVANWISDSDAEFNRADFLAACRVEQEVTSGRD